MRGRGGNRGCRGTTRGGLGNRGAKRGRGRGYNAAPSSLNYVDNLSHNSAYNAASIESSLAEYQKRLVCKCSQNFLSVGA